MRRETRSDVNAEHRALRTAHRLGVVQEAERLRCAVVASEHLLMATLADPVVRSAVQGIGVALRDVQVLVTKESRGRQRRRDDDAFTITPEAVELIDRATGGLREFQDDRRPAPVVLSAALGSVMLVLLRDERETAARRILSELDVVRYRSSLVALIENSPGSTPAADRDG